MVLVIPERSWHWCLHVLTCSANFCVNVMDDDTVRSVIWPIKVCQNLYDQIGKLNRQENLSGHIGSVSQYSKKMLQLLQVPRSDR